MKAQARFKGVRWMLLAVITLAPTAVFAQQDNVSQSEKQQGQGQPAEAAETKTEETGKQTEAAPVKTEAAQGETKETSAKTEETQGQPQGTQAQTEKDAKTISGMSILGNQEAPKSLVIVPWKSSEIGDSIGISTMLDDSRQPIDKEVFMRMLSYYEVRSNPTRHDGAAAEKSEAAQPATAAHRR